MPGIAVRRPCRHNSRTGSPRWAMARAARSYASTTNRSAPLTRSAVATSRSTAASSRLLPCASSVITAAPPPTGVVCLPPVCRPAPPAEHSLALPAC